MLAVPSPLTILFAQAIAVAAGVVPLMRAAGSGWIAWVVAVSYGLAPGFGALIGFDFHEVAFAVPLLSLSMAAMLRADHQVAVLWALPLVLVKEDLGLTIAALGAVVFLRGSRRLGVFAMVFGVVAFLAITAFVLPALNGDTGGFADKYAPSGPSDALRILADGASGKVRTVLFLLIPTGFLALRSPALLLVAVPTFGWRFLSDRQTYWDPWYQYDAVLVPIAVAAMIEGARLLQGRVPDFVRGIALTAAWARSCWCRGRRCPRRGTATSGGCRPEWQLSTARWTRSRPGAGWRRRTTSVAGSLCVPSSTSSGTRRRPAGHRYRPRSSTRWSGWPSTGSTRWWGPRRGWVSPSCWTPVSSTWSPRPEG